MWKSLQKEVGLFMKKIVGTFILVVFTFILSTGAGFAIERENTTNQSKQVIDYSSMTDMQIAMMLISKQINYLMQQIDEAEGRIGRLTEEYEGRISREEERVSRQIAALEDKVSKLEINIQEKEAELRETEKALHQLEREKAIFISESGLYLKILLGFLAGTVFGGIIGSILHWWKARGLNRPG